MTGYALERIHDDSDFYRLVEDGRQPCTDITGSVEEWLAIADALAAYDSIAPNDPDDISFRRCAIHFRGHYAYLICPRNAHGADDSATLFPNEYQALAEIIRNTIAADHHMDGAGI